jgi:hypothetical protein
MSKWGQHSFINHLTTVSFAIKQQKHIAVSFGPILEKYGLLASVILLFTLIYVGRAEPAVFCLPFTVHRLPFTVRRPSFTVQ